MRLNLNVCVPRRKRDLPLGVEPSVILLLVAENVSLVLNLSRVSYDDPTTNLVRRLEV